MLHFESQKNFIRDNIYSSIRLSCDMFELQLHFAYGKAKLELIRNKLQEKIYKIILNTIPDNLKNENLYFLFKFQISLDFDDL